MADQTKADKEAAAAEAKRREALTQEERDQEDLAALEAQIAAENAAKGLGSGNASAAAQRASLIARMQRDAKAARDKEATVEVTVARGRSIFLNADQTVPFQGGAKIMVTPDEEVKLRQAGHLVNPDGAVIEPSGPRVLQEAGLIQGHAAGQGQTSDGKPTPAAKGK